MTKNKLKVLIVSPYNGLVGGISRWTEHILNYYNSIIDKTTIELEQFYPDGKQVYSNTPTYKRIAYGIQKSIPFIITLRRKFKSTHFDLVHFCSSASISLIRDVFAAKIAKKYNIPSVFHFRFGRIPELFKIRNWEQKLIHKLISLADKIIVIDQSSYNTLIKEGYKNIELLPNPLTPEVNKIINNNTHLKRKNGVILFVGHVVKNKGVFELVEACKDLPNIKVKIVGHINDEIKKALFESAGEKNDWLEIVGELNYESTVIEMLSCGLFVLPTYTEGFPNVIIESMACGCPIVTTCVGAIPEMLDIENGNNYGFCIEPKNVKALKESIQKMLNNREYALECGKNAQRRVNELYSMSKVWNQLEAIWSS